MVKTNFFQIMRTNMLKKTAAEEIAQNMNIVLKGERLPTRSEKLASALENLNDAAELFDSAGQNEQAEMVTEVIQALASELVKGK